MKRLRLSHKIFVAKSRISRAGRGVFADALLRKGKVIETCPVIRITGSDVPLVKQTNLKNYYFIWHEPKKIATRVALCLGFGSMYNHSYNPNATYRKMIKRDLIEFIAIRDIRSGEEITVNYNYGKPTDLSTLWIKTIKPARS